MNGDHFHRVRPGKKNLHRQREQLAVVGGEGRRRPRRARALDVDAVPSVRFDSIDSTRFGFGRLYIVSTSTRAVLEASCSRVRACACMCMDVASTPKLMIRGRLPVIGWSKADILHHGRSPAARVRARPRGCWRGRGVAAGAPGVVRDYARRQAYERRAAGWRVPAEPISSG